MIPDQTSSGPGSALNTCQVSCKADKTCKKEYLPEVVTEEVEVIDAGIWKTFVIHANVISEGSRAVTARAYATNFYRVTTSRTNGISARCIKD